MLRLKGKVSLVTGSSERYGKPMVEALAEAGAIVITASRTLENNEFYTATLREKGLRSFRNEPLLRQFDGGKRWRLFCKIKEI